MELFRKIKVSYFLKKKKKENSRNIFQYVQITVGPEKGRFQKIAILR